MNAKGRKGNLLKLRTKEKRKKRDEIIEIRAEERNWGGFNASRVDKEGRERENVGRD